VNVARQFAATHDMEVKEEIERLAKEFGKLKQPWVFVAR
jgi:HAMP domain-containing protein